MLDFLDASDVSAESSFLDVLEWIQEEFPETLEDLPEVPRPSESQVTACFAESKAQSSLPALLWSRGCRDTLNDTNVVLAESGGDKPSGSQRQAKSIPPFTFQYKFYKVLGMDSAQAAPVNRPLEDLVPSANQANFRSARPDVTLDDVKAWEASARKARAILSALDWQMSTAVRILQRECETAPSPGLSRALRLMFSAGKSTFQLQRENSTTLGNLMLKRRDPLLQRLPRQLSEKDKQALRCSSLSTGQLFDSTVVTLAAANLQSALTRDVQMRAVNPPSRPAARSSSGSKAGSSSSRGRSVVSRPAPAYQRPPAQTPRQPPQPQQRFSSNPQGRAAAPGDQRSNQRGRNAAPSRPRGRRL